MNYDRECAVIAQEHDPRCECGGRFSQHVVTDLFGHTECSCQPEWFPCKCREFKEAK